jgi:hypothetical protein
MTSIENLSNELFHDIFDYLEAADIYMAFSNLNHRFQQLLNNSSLLFKIKQMHHSLSDATSFQNWMQIMHINRQQILSIRLLMSLYFNNLFSLLYINSSFQHLESIVLLSPQPNTLKLILNELISLPRLFSLTIKPYHFSRDLTDIYRIVLTLPVLLNILLLIIVVLSMNFQQLFPIHHSFAILVFSNHTKFLELLELLFHSR